MSTVLFVIFLISVREILADSRIVFGVNAKEGEFPYAVSLRMNNDHICGGTILNEQFILTAAHCVPCDNSKSQKTGFSVQYGLINITNKPDNTIDVKNIICNKYDRENVIFDSAVLELENPIPNGNASAVKLSREFICDKPKTGTIIGWGKLFHNGPLSRTLQKKEVDIFDENTCGKKFDNMHHICFGATTGGACNGDSGTALLVDGVQVGIASFITSTCGIANEENPNVYSKVATYYDWIRKMAKL